MKTDGTKKGRLQAVKETGAREPEALTEEHAGECLGAIRRPVVGSVTEEEAARHSVLPEDICACYGKRPKDAGRYIKERF